MMKYQILAAAIVALSTSAASAAVIDFETGFSNGDDITGLDLGGITLSKGGETIRVTTSVPGIGSSFAIQSDPFVGINAFRADFSAAISFFSVDMGDFGPSDDDFLSVSAFDAFNTLLDTDTFNFGAAGNFLQTLSVSSSNIAYVLFDGGSAAFPSSIFADNLTFTPMDSAVVPLPAAGLLLLGGLGALGALRHRRKQG